jgi:hypothetical protein
MINKIKYFVVRYWISITFILLAIYFYEPVETITHCSPNSLMVGNQKTILGLGEMTLMWILMAIAHGANACYCDIRYLLNKK